MKIFLLTIITFIISQLFLVSPVHAAISSCTVSVSPDSVYANSATDFNFGITNNDSSNSLIWVKITKPSNNFTITGTPSAGGDVTSSDATFSGAFSLGPSGGSINLTLSAQAGSFGVSSADWIVQASDDPNGASPVNCFGLLGTSINGPSAVNISNIAVSDIADSEAKITWTTDTISNSSIDYGTSSSYGLSKSDGAQMTSHTINLSGLSANTTYHYNLKSINDNGIAQSGNRTFVTAKAGVSGTSTNNTTTVITIIKTPAPTPTPSSTPTPTSSYSPKSSKSLPEVLGVSTQNLTYSSPEPASQISSSLSLSPIQISLITTIFNALLLGICILVWHFLKTKRKIHISISMASKILSTFLVALVTLSQFLYPLPIKATISSCSASVSPSSVDAGSNNSFSFGITNNDSDNSLIWVKITRPSSNFTITGSPDQGATVTESDVTYSGAFSLGPSGGSINLTLSATASSFGASSADWIVQASDDPNGASPINCSGSLVTSISGPSAVNISNIAVSDISDSQSKISWTTNSNSNSQVSFGTTASYGTTKTDDSQTTSHSITLTSLSSNTTYHYKVTSTDSNGASDTSGDNTFVTAKAGIITSTTITTTTTTGTPTATTAPKAGAAADSTSPSVFVDDNFSKPFESPPTITGRATDATGVARVEYSIDDGKNWLEVDEVKNLGGKSITFSFVPVIFEDGNYRVKVRAKDPSGNIGVSKIYVLIIDRLPPQIGAVAYSIGAQLLIPDKDGTMFALSAMDQKITLSAVGGPITIDILSGTQMYSLVKNVDNGLWSGVLSFSKPGIYQLTAKAVDGAGNKTERKIGTVVVLDNGKVVSSSSSVSSGTVTLWYFDIQTQNFVVWDGKPYGQSNPQTISKNGEYRFIAPAGKYYLEVKSPGFTTLRTTIFTLESSTPVVTKLGLKKSPALQLGPFALVLPDFSSTSADITIKSPIVPSGLQPAGSIVGNEFPNADLFLDGKKVSIISFRGKPTVFSFLSTWSPSTSEQLQTVEDLSTNSQINVVPVISQESSTYVSVFRKRGEYSSLLLADPDGLFVKPLGFSFLPTNIFLDRKGIIQKVKIGVLTKDEILENLVN